LAGFNEVEMALRHLVLGEPIVQPNFESMVVLRHLSDTVVRPDELLAPVDDAIPPVTGKPT
jgi:carbamoyl-phosphate synthase large subunit